ncbi:MAG: hypothetical protein COY09_02060 [Candidatus Portnoybacteria bacterium CG_4_10_14_0_2_um_filter_39_11]|uniref:Uncharacterized protein n=1 Tax=Candidatus Portnoybacteria bacterium CG_4_10_14_0_2_um_filter_39_11 TaxID=1974797 RepID=A0A2M7UHX2_9BACT|nr:MAG: hypothetical protein AUJ33_01060 [Parcubacteria group bacterium CG1_02_40_25]PIZ70835.1 MAG: hypothetical protein COY09_02060 [Candidatus Portnoybacteria bacterium CG_4_10_14_0_2_um_filter_39_11]
MRLDIQTVMPDNSGTSIIEQALSLRPGEILVIDTRHRLTEIAHELIKCPCGPHYIIIDHWGMDIDKGKKGRRRKTELKAIAIDKTNLIEEITVRTRTPDNAIRSISAKSFWGVNKKGVLYADLAIKREI